MCQHYNPELVASLRCRDKKDGMLHMASESLTSLLLLITDITYFFCSSLLFCSPPKNLGIEYMLLLTYISEVMKTGSANLNFLRCDSSQLPLSNVSLFTVLFTANVGFFLLFLACFLVRDLFSCGCRQIYPPLCFYLYSQFPF